MSVPFTFATASSPIPLSELDTNFATPITIGTTPFVLGGTYNNLSGVETITVNGDITSTDGYIISTDSGGYSALQDNAVTVGNPQTGIYYNGSDAIGLQVNNTSVFAFFENGNFLWNGDSIPAPSGNTTQFLRNDGTWAVPGGSGGGDVFLANNQTFTGLNTFTQLVECSESGGYSALQNNSVTVGNAQTGMNYAGGQLNWQINNTTVASLQSTGTFYSTNLNVNSNIDWGGYNISAPGGNTGLFLRNDGTWASPPGGASLSANQTFTGNNTFTGVITSQAYNYSGNVSTYYNGSSIVGYNNGGTWVLATNGDFTISGYGYQPGGGSWSSSSDSRLKSNVVPLLGALDKLLKLKPVSYKWKIKADGEPTVGFLAQDVLTTIPNAVKSRTPTKAESKYIADETLTIGWQNDMMAYLVGAIQDLNSLVTAQATEIEALKAKVGV